MPRTRDLQWIHRGKTGGIVAALRELDLPSEPGVAYVAGEARDCQAIRRHLVVERGWARSRVIVKPFWTPGKRGLD